MCERMSDGGVNNDLNRIFSENQKPLKLFLPLSCISFKVYHLQDHLTVCRIKSETKSQCESKEEQCPLERLISFIGVSFPTVSNPSTVSSESHQLGCALLFLREVQNIL